MYYIHFCNIYIYILLTHIYFELYLHIKPHMGFAASSSSSGNRSSAAACGAGLRAAHSVDPKNGI